MVVVAEEEEEVEEREEAEEATSGKTQARQLPGAKALKNKFENII